MKGGDGALNKAVAVGHWPVRPGDGILQAAETGDIVTVVEAILLCCNGELLPTDAHAGAAAPTVAANELAVLHLVTP